MVASSTRTSDGKQQHITAHNGTTYYWEDPSAERFYNNHS
jgi:hypothetical protein